MDYSMPPSYVEATNQEWLPLLAPYLDSTSLCSAALVSAKWHRNLVPWLWGNPASHFGTEGDRVYVALTRFKRTLSRARVHVRQLTHTLHLPPAQTELYDRPQYQWLRDVLEWLPNLRCLVVSQIPFFDHSALLALRRPSVTSDDDFQDGPPVFPLRLLIASKCTNCTPASLAAVFVHFPALTFLDLSHNPAAREENVLNSIGQMNQLQILKLRKVGLRDIDLEHLAEALKREQLERRTKRQTYRLRSLDVRDNHLTNQAVKIITTEFIHSDHHIHSLRHIYERRPSEGDWSQIQAPYTSRTNDQLREPELDQHFIRALTQPYGSRIYLEDLDLLGLTHLYIAHNYITTEALLDLVKTRNLHVLDAGDLDARNLISPLTNKPSQHEKAVEQLTHSLEADGGETMTYIRIDHAVVTASAGKAPQELTELDATDSQLPNVHEIHGESLPIRAATKPPSLRELPNDGAPAYELPAQEVVYAELEGSSVLGGRRLTPAIKQSLASLPSYRSEEYSSLPEVVTQDMSRLEPSAHVSTSSKVTKFSKISRQDAFFEIARLVGKRQELRHGIRDEKRGLLPGLAPAMQTLALTGIPPQTRSAALIENLKDFIADCATEHCYASEQACLEHFLVQTHESSRGEAIRTRARELFALQRVILELAPTKSGEPSEAETLPSPSTPTHIRSLSSKFKTQSALNDRDTESLWEAAKNDFSFFDDEECGVPASDINSQFPISSVPEKIVLLEDGSGQNGNSLTSQPQPGNKTGAPLQPLRDVVMDIARWRADRKREHDAAPYGAFTPGFWPGEIKIVRPSQRSIHGHVDYYGNYFEKGVYR